MLLENLGRHGRSYPFVVAGTGFGSLFFVHRLLQHRPDAKVLMLEWGQYRPWEVQLEEHRNSDIHSNETFHNIGDGKPWNFTIAYGGGTNCWYGTAARLHPSDFRTRSLYGRGRDWPLTYDELEPYYLQAERIMDVSGPDDIAAVCPRSGPYPQPPHKLSSVERIVKQAHPGLHFPMPTGRARVANAQRNQCCASLRCQLCPNNAKFTAHNGFTHIMEHPNVHIVTRAEVRELERSGRGSVSAVRFRHGGREERVACDFCVLGANAIHSPAILARSSIAHPLQGRGLNEQLGYGVEVMLDGIDNFDGSTITTGINYALYDGTFRAEYGGAVLAFENRPLYGLRPEYGRWRQVLVITVNIEDEPRPENRVSVDADGEAMVDYHGPSDFARKGAERALDKIAGVLAPLPVEKIVFKGFRETESHVQGTLRMGANAQDSVVGPDLLHHEIRNLAVVGTAVLPTCPATPPSLTAAALSLRAADRLLA